MLIKIHSLATVKKEWFSAFNAACDTGLDSFKLTQDVGDLMTWKNIFRVTLKKDTKDSEICNAWNVLKKAEVEEMWWFV